MSLILTLQKHEKSLPSDQQGILAATAGYKGSWGCIKKGPEALWDEGLGFNIQHLLLIICIGFADETHRNLSGCIVLTQSITSSMHSHLLLVRLELKLNAGANAVSLG